MTAALLDDIEREARKVARSMATVTVIEEPAYCAVYMLGDLEASKARLIRKWPDVEPFYLGWLLANVTAEHVTGEAAEPSTH